MAYRMKGTTMYNKIKKDENLADKFIEEEKALAENKLINTKVKKTKFYNLAEKLKVKKMNAKAKKKFEGN